MLTKRIIDRLDSDRRRKWGEVFRFGVVGVAATLIQYGVYLLLIGHVHAGIANTVGYAVSFVFNFMASVRYTFRVKASARRGAGFALSHAVNYGLQTVILTLMLWLGVPKTWAPLPMFGICVPVNFLLVRFFLKR